MLCSLFLVGVFLLFMLNYVRNYVLNVLFVVFLLRLLVLIVVQFYMNGWIDMVVVFSLKVNGLKFSCVVELIIVGWLVVLFLVVMVLVWYGSVSGFLVVSVLLVCWQVGLMMIVGCVVVFVSRLVQGWWMVWSSLEMVIVVCWLSRK